MSSANYSISFSTNLDAAAASVNAGDCLVLNATGTGYLVGNTANKGANGRCSCIALTAAMAPGAVSTQAEGQVDASITGLAPLAGPEQFAIVNSSGRLVRIASPAVSDECVGKVDQFGNVRLSFAGVSFVTPTPAVSSPYTLSGASVALTPGDAFCTVPGSAGVVTKATSAAVTAAGGAIGVVGVVAAAWNPGDTLSYAASVAAASTGLGAGIACKVGLSSTGRLLRATSTSCTADSKWIGQVDTSGNVLIAPYRMGPSLDPRDYGCKWDGVTDDLTQFNAMMATISAPGINGADVILPGGGTLAWMSDDLYLDRPITLSGRGGGLTDLPTSGITFAPGKGMKLVNTATTNDRPVPVAGGNFTGGKVQNLELYSTALLRANAAGCIRTNRNRAQNTLVKNGDVVVAAAGANPTRFYRASTAAAGGLTANVAGDPTWAALGGTPVVDGAVTWTTEAFPQDHEVNTAVVVGERCFIIGDNRYYFECTIAGTTDAPAPVAIVSSTNATPIVVTATAHGLSTGDRVYINGHTTNTNANGNHYVVRLTADTFSLNTISGSNVVTPVAGNGVGGGTGNTYKSTHPDDMSEGQPPSNFLITDGTAQWQRKIHAGIHVTTDCTVGPCFWEGFTGAAVHAEGDSTATDPNVRGDIDFFRMIGRQAYYCGLGAYVGGFDGSATCVRDFNTTTMGANRTVKDQLVGAGGMTIWDHGLTGGSHYHCYAQVGYGPAYYQNITTTVNFTDCKHEVLWGDIISSAGMTVNDTGANATSTHVRVKASGGIGLFETTSKGTKTVTASILENSSNMAAYVLTTSDDSGGLSWAMRYQYSGTEFAPRTGWWSYAWGTQNSHCAISYSTTAAIEGPGHWSDTTGHYCGRSGTQYIQGVDIYALTDKRYQGGYQPVGSRFKVQGTGAPGTWSEYVVSVAGYRGPTRVSNTVYSAGSPVYGIFGDIIEPVANETPLPGTTRKAFKCTTGGTSRTSGAGGEPTATYNACVSLNVALTGATNATPIVITTASTGALTTGDHVTISGVLGNTAANGTFAVTVASGTTFSLDTSVGNGVYTSGGTYSHAVVDGTCAFTYVGFVPTYSLSSFNDSRSTTVSTTDGTLTTIMTIPIPLSTTKILRCLVTADERTGTGSVDGAAFDIQAAYTNVAGTAVLKGTAITRTFVNLNGTAWTAVFTISTGNILVQVTGDAGPKNIDWTCKRVDEELS